MVITDVEGGLIAIKSKFLGTKVTNNFAEWSALEGAVTALAHLAGQQDSLEAEIRADSQLVVRQFNRQYKIKEPALRAIAERVWKNLAAEPGLTIKLKHVPREENTAADAAVNRELDNYQKSLEKTK
jgi:ribonuclease HI